MGDTSPPDVPSEPVIRDVIKRISTKLAKNYYKSKADTRPNIKALKTRITAKKRKARGMNISKNKSPIEKEIKDEEGILKRLENLDKGLPEPPSPPPEKRVLDVNFNEWIPWGNYPDASAISFKSQKKGEGNGERKLAFILGTKPNGQNKRHDLDICVEIKGGELCKLAEIKEIEKDNSFFPGATGRNGFRITKANIASLQDIFRELKGAFAPYLTEEILGYMSCHEEKGDGTVLKYDIITMTPDEVSQTNLPRLIATCYYLRDKRQQILSSEKRSKRYDIHEPMTGILTKVDSTMVYNSLLLWKKSPEEIRSVLGDDIYNDEKFLKLVEHKFIDEPNFLPELCKSFGPGIFSGYQVILVNKDKGFYIPDRLDNRLRIYRITRAYPKFIVAFDGDWTKVVIPDEDAESNSQPQADEDENTNNANEEEGGGGGGGGGP
jgi:hypothetical protein